MNELEIFEFAKTRVKYDEKTGNLIWLEKEVTSHFDKIFNTRFGGKQAGWSDGDGYVVVGVSVCGQRYEIRAHRLIWFIKTGDIPTYIDHKNHNRSDNRFSNLRAIESKQENQKNQSKHTNNTSGVTGVVYSKKRDCWIAQIGVDYKNKNLGYFKVFEEAVKARKEAEILYKFHKQHGG